MSINQNALKPVAQRVPPPPFFHPLRGSGNYRDSVIRAPLYSQVGFTPGAEVKIALFMQDVPVLLSADSEYGQSLYTTAWVDMPPFNFIEPGISLVETLGTTGDLQSVAAVTAGQVSRIRLVTAGIEVPAYAALLTIVDRGLTSAPPGLGGPALCDLNLSAIAESGVIAGVPTFASFAGGDPLSVWAPVILPSTDYTQAIRDNDNVVVSGSLQFTVVGVYEQVLPPT